MAKWQWKSIDIFFWRVKIMGGSVRFSGLGRFLWVPGLGNIHLTCSKYIEARFDAGWTIERGLL